MKTPQGMQGDFMSRKLTKKDAQLITSLSKAINRYPIKLRVGGLSPKEAAKLMRMSEGPLKRQSCGICSRRTKNISIVEICETCRERAESF